MKHKHMIQTHECEVCGKVFKNRELWRKHIVIHDDSKRCNFCPLCPHLPGFISKSNLKKHHWKHHGGEQPARPFACEFCGTAYSLEHLLMRHKIKVHNIWGKSWSLVEKLKKKFLGIWKYWRKNFVLFLKKKYF